MTTYSLSSGVCILWPHHDPNLAITLTFSRPLNSEFNPNTSSGPSPHPPTQPSRHICSGVQGLRPGKKEWTKPEPQMKFTQFVIDLLPTFKRWCLFSHHCGKIGNVSEKNRLLPQDLAWQQLSPDSLASLHCGWSVNRNNIQALNHSGLHHRLGYLSIRMQ